MAVLKYKDPATGLWVPISGPTPVLTDTPGVSTLRTSAFTAAASTGYTMSWTDEERDSDGYWSSGAPTRWTVPAGQGGWYLLSVTLFMYPGTSWTGAFIWQGWWRKNGGNFGTEWSDVGYAGGSYMNLSDTRPVYLADGDYIEVFFNQTTGTSQNVIGTGSMVRLAAGTPGPQGPAGTVDAAAGVTFPATQVPSTDVHTFDDYEEGDWTPSWYAVGGGAAASVTAYGRYVKRGRWVKVSGSLIAGRGTLSGIVYIAGLPFNVGTDTGLTWYAGSVGYYNGFVAVTGGPGIYANASVPGKMGVVVINGGASTQMTADPYLLTSGCHIIFTCEYEAAE